ncbi:hypothetical protein GIB67_009709 [Kingdonia uniflora]|uniref:DNA-directed DNA polymerase n=1 Tax=Kingdonia uniflora TaxID=39325 RepID=A0A7J7LBD6_9MAGN|nr:hypothetical protein GIB67_009709 [Kingdonia uniflora]
MHSSIFLLKGYTFEKKPSLFKNFISEVYESRFKAKKNGDDAMSYGYKILMNSLYGRFGYVNDSDWKPPKNSVVQIAAAITAYAGIYMYQFTSRNNCYYTDIDSAILGKLLLEELVSSTVLVLNTILRRMAHYNPFDNLQSPGDDSNTVDTGNNSSSNASSNKKRGLARGSKPLPNGKKEKIDVNSWGQPNQANSETNTYTSDIGFQARMHLPIIYESFKHVPNDRIALVVKGLEECYDISHVAWFDLKEKIKDAWRRYKYRLNTTLIVGNNPEDVKASPAPEFVPREDWVKFVDYCNSEKFLAKSKRNKENWAKLIAPCTLGRTSLPITRHKLAEERGVTDEEIGRVEVYIPAHTKKDKTIQCPDVIAELQNTMRKDRKSIRTGPNDAVAQKFGKERKGGTRGMGAGMSISLVEKVGHIVNENEELRSNNNEFKFATEKDVVVRDAVSWNTLVSRYLLCGDVDAARWVFDQMEEKNLVNWSTMVTGYTRVGKLNVARWFFVIMPERNVVSWNAIIVRYTQNEKYSEVIDLFYQMREVGDGGRGRRVKPNNVTLVSVLSSCAHLGALDLGKWIDRFINQNKMELNVLLGNALADMFAKCGCVEEWFAMYDQVEEAFRYFLKMLECRVKPNKITFTRLLSACTRTGMVEKGLEYFNQMENEYGVTPKVEHYGCIVNLLSRAGCINDIDDLINPMPIRPNVIVWGALLGGCQIHKDISRGVHVVQRILEINSDHSGSYVYLANVYASMGRLDDAAICRLRMWDNCVKRTPGCSWIEVNNTVHEFFIGDRSHPLTDRIYLMLSELGTRLKLAGYEPKTELVVHNVHEEEKEDALFTHSKKLAISFGLISTSHGTTIRILKNLRVCTDCHEATKIMSKIVCREIIVRDRSRFHLFKDKKCSCNDYW